MAATNSQALRPGMWVQGPGDEIVRRIDRIEYVENRGQLQVKVTRDNYSGSPLLLGPDHTAEVTATPPECSAAWDPETQTWHVGLTAAGDTRLAIGLNDLDLFVGLYAEDLAGTDLHQLNDDLGELARRYDVDLPDHTLDTLTHLVAQVLNTNRPSAAPTEES